jgi:hypothetical protein
MRGAGSMVAHDVRTRRDDGVSMIDAHDIDPRHVFRDIPEIFPRLGLGSFGAGEKMGGPRDGMHSTYLDWRFSGLRCGSVQNSWRATFALGSAKEPHSLVFSKAAGYRSTHWKFA